MKERSAQDPHGHAKSAPLWPMIVPSLGERWIEGIEEDIVIWKEGVPKLTSGQKYFL